MKNVIALVFVLASSSAMAGPFMGQDRSAGARQGLSDLVKAIGSVNAEGLSCEQDSDCVALAIGSRACGGPNGFVVSSRLNPYFSSVESMANLTSSLEDDINMKDRVFSICSIELPPPVACISNICQ